MKQTFKEYVEGRVSKENLERDLETYKGQSLEKIYPWLWEFWAKQNNPKLYKVDIEKLDQVIYVAAYSEEHARDIIKSGGNEYRNIEYIREVTKKSHTIFLSENFTR